MTSSSLTLELLGREHNNGMPWAQKTVAHSSGPSEIKLWDFLYSEWGGQRATFSFLAKVLLL
jgi:hypothetical protein